MEAEEFRKRVSVRSGIHGRDQVFAAIECAFEALRARISHHTGDNIASQLPLELKHLWKSGAEEHGERESAEVERLDLNAFLDRIRSRLGLAEARDARQLVRAVFTTLQEQITPGAANKVASEFPEDIRALWIDSAPEDRPIESPTSRAAQPEQEEKPPLADRYEEGEGPEITTHPWQRGKRPVESYTSEEIGPSAATVFRSDEQIKAEVMELLEASDELDASTIDVQVHAGQVTLDGTVHRVEELVAARRIARETLGTIDVIDHLKLEEG